MGVFAKVGVVRGEISKLASLAHSFPPKLIFLDETLIIRVENPEKPSHSSSHAGTSNLQFQPCTLRDLHILHVSYECANCTFSIACNRRPEHEM